MLTGFDLATFQALLSAQRKLLQTNETAREISLSLRKCGHNLNSIKQRTAALESVMAPLLSQSKKSQHLVNCIENAVESSEAVLEAAKSVRVLENLVLAGHPVENLEGYLGAALKLEGRLNFVAENLPTALGLLEEAVRVSNSSPFVDKYGMRRLNGCIVALKSSAMDGCGESRGLLGVVAQKLEASFKLLLADLAVSNKKNLETLEDKQVLKFDVSVDNSVKEIAQFLKRHGRAQQCLKMYWDARVRVLKEGFQSMKQGYLRWDIDNVGEVKWDDVEGHVLSWVRLLGVALRGLLWPERQMCCGVFEGFEEEVWTGCFGKLALVGGMDSLLHFGEAIAVGQREPQAVFKLLDMFEGLEDLKGDWERVCGGFGCMELRLRFRELQKQLAHGCCKVLSEFSKKVEEEDSGLPANGSLLRITSYAVNYLKFLVGEYRPVMLRVLEIREMEDPQLGLCRAIEDVFGALERNLEGRSKGYAEPALANLFLMNHYWYIFKRARDSELAFLGEDWLKERRRWVNQQVLAYEKQEWGPVFVHLNREGLAGSAGSRAKELFKQRLRAFNMAFDQICETHRHWVIYDDELREATLVKITQVLLPAYRSFIETFGHLLDNTTNGNRYLKYTPEQLEDLLADLFSEKCSRLSNATKDYRY